MKTSKCDMFFSRADAICITTNGVIKKNGQAVMGRGVARIASSTWYGLSAMLGAHLKLDGNNVVRLTSGKKIPYLSLPRKRDPLKVPVPYDIVSFPVKHRWDEQADVKLIKKSCKQLKKLIERHGWERVLLPRPGCGNGQLDWKKDVRPIVKKYFGSDDRVVVVTLKTKETQNA